MGTGDLEIVRMVIPLFAHMGGIDEIGIFVIPALLAIYVLRRTKREARRRAAAESESGAGGPSATVEVFQIPTRPPI